MTAGPRRVAASTVVDSALSGVVTRAVDVAVTHLSGIGRSGTPLPQAQTTVDTTRNTFTTALAAWGAEVSTGPGVHRLAADGTGLPPDLSGRPARVTPPSAPGGGGLDLQRHAWALTRVRRLAAFHGGTADRLDLLVTTLPGEWSPALALAGDLGAVVDVVAREADRRGLNVTSIRSPSAGFSPTQWAAADSRADPPLEGVDPHLARGCSVRVTLALDDPTTDDRIGMLARLLVVAEERSWGLHVADRRYGALRGHWVCLRRLKAMAPDPLPPMAGSEPVPVSVLGPSRQGSAADVMRVLAGTTVLAFVGVGLDGMDVMNAVVQLPRGAAAGGAGGARIPVIPLGDLPVALGTGPSRGTGTEPARGSEAADYEAVVSGPVPVADLATPAGAAPVWVQFEVRDLAHGDPEPEYAGDILQLFEQSGDLVGPPFVEYHLQRWAGARRRARVERLKLAVRLRDLPGTAATVDERLLALCEDVQNRRADLMAVGRTAGRAGRIANVRIAARERWLGSWLDDPA